MTGSGLALTVAASLAWGALDALRKALASDISPATLTALLVLGQLPVFGLWLLASGDAAHIGPGYWVIGASAAGGALVASMLFIAALRASPLSVCVPMLALTPVFATLSGWLLAGEAPSGGQLAGVALVVCGALLLSWPRRGARGVLVEPGVYMMMGVAALWAITLTLDKLALEQASPPAHALAQAAMIVAGLLVLQGARGRLGELPAARSRWRLLLPAVVCISVATGAQLLALQEEMLISLVEAIKRAIGLGLSVVVGRLAFAEPVTAPKVAAVLLMGGGVVALSVL